ncbi:23S rRNA (guanine(745)-N(1))-methyltransferase [Zhongshania aliphaticivorans]|uniref:23S rRNA (Guanine(745)-N(1))-methyltransferase n=1 Tax=Zhongshania aliphaticivorans TaxID=1470434 RepID=A0A5S9MZA3_9GAMM|nr:methyltransferase domain-containing protein [Zhongshania aliphaticivorans]CAA0082033.1 23S rRNA (guanine(745)-N(1))-methyltransferase [Zhongshania aliphaticivorans]CAA0084609.1 23S rRNA (guanine(745)-N(1))-methyltransferase [Zhongshania aliphaticivorans]
MPLLPLTQLVCPLDQKVLLQTGNTWRCENNHCFDIAKQGHVNLLPVQNKKSKDPGDSKEMIAARRDFLNSGVYNPIAEALANTVNALCGDQDQLAILDAGCGEGYYLNSVCDALLTKDIQLQATGLDISKWAVRSCKIRNPKLNGLVASNRQIPLPDQSQDIVLCTFGFPVYSEFKRVLKPGGHIVMADPGTEHLIELRSAIYDDVRRSPPADISPALDDNWQLSVSQKVQFTSPVINAMQCEQLLVMTPHLYRASKEGRDRAAQLHDITITGDVLIRVISQSNC